VRFKESDSRSLPLCRDLPDTLNRTLIFGQRLHSYGDSLKFLKAELSLIIAYWLVVSGIKNLKPVPLHF